MKELPLHSNQAETGVIGALLRLAHSGNTDAAIDAATTVREKLPAAAFWSGAHRAVIEKIYAQAEARKPFDSITLGQLLQNDGLGDIGGEIDGDWYPNAVSFVMTLATCMPTAAFLAEHIDIVHDKFVRREIEDVASQLQKDVRESQDADVRVLLDQAQSKMLAIAERNSKEESWRKPKEGVMIAMNKLQEAYENRGDITGLPSGLMDLDRMTTGWKPGQLIIAAGSTGMGKTSFMLQCAAHLAIHCKIPVAFFSLEMGYEEIIERMLYAEARVSLQRARDGMLAERDFQRFSNAMKTVAEANLYVDDFPGLNSFEFKARSRRAVKKFGVKAIFGDYLQLFDDDGGADDNRVQQLARVSRGAKLTAKELAVPVMLGAQLNRKPDERNTQIVVNPFVKDENGRPMKFKRLGVPQLGDLRECGAIAQDADIVLAPYRPWYWSKDNEHDKAEQHVEWAQIIVMKQRNGPVGPVHVQFIDDETRFQTLPDENGNPRTHMYHGGAKQQQQPGYEPKHGDTSPATT